MCVCTCVSVCVCACDCASVCGRMDAGILAAEKRIRVPL